jgi:hypothetical protein
MKEVAMHIYISRTNGYLNCLFPPPPCKSTYFQFHQLLNPSPNFSFLFATSLGAVIPKAPVPLKPTRIPITIRRVRRNLQFAAALIRPRVQRNVAASRRLQDLDRAARACEVVSKCHTNM